MFHKLLKKRALAVIASRLPDFKIGPPGNPYMLRWWWLPRNRFFNIYIHRILHDDEDRALHDHPWESLSYLVEGRLIEYYKTDTYEHMRCIREKQWVRRSATFAHRLVLDSKTATTIFITGPRVREWGFHCPKGWVHWRDFVSRDDKGSVGRGCGETED